MRRYDLFSCPERELRAEREIPSSPFYPASVWGGYLPGDEAEQVCAISGQPCPPDDLPDPEDCPRFSATGHACAPCATAGEAARLFLDSLDDELVCPVCGRVTDAPPAEAALPELWARDSPDLAA